MKNRYYSYVTRINHHYSRTIEISEKMNLDDLDFDTIDVDAFLFNILQIGELISKAPIQFVSLLNKADVKGIVDIRNFIVHGYEKINKDNILNCFRNGLPRLISDINNKAFEEYLKSLSALLGKTVEVFVEKRYGSEEKDILLKMNYGYIDDVVAPNGEFQIAYIIDLETPIKRCFARVVGIVKNNNDYYLLTSTADLSYSKESLSDLLIRSDLENYEIIKIKN